MNRYIGRIRKLEEELHALEVEVEEAQTLGVEPRPALFASIAAIKRSLRWYRSRSQQAPVHVTGVGEALEA